MQAGQVDQLFGDFHFGVEAAFFGHVAEPAAVAGGERNAVEHNLARRGAGIRGEHAENDAHGRGLAGSIAADEAGHPTVADGEAHVVQHLAAAVVLVDVSDLEHGNPFFLI